MYVIKAKFKHGVTAYYQPDDPSCFVDNKKDAKKYSRRSDAEAECSSGHEIIERA